MMGWTAVLSFKLQEVTTYHVEAALGTSTGTMFIGKKHYAVAAGLGEGGARQVLGRRREP